MITCGPSLCFIQQCEKSPFNNLSEFESTLRYAQHPKKPKKNFYGTCNFSLSGSFEEERPLARDEDRLFEGNV